MSDRNDATATPVRDRVVLIGAAMHHHHEMSDARRTASGRMRRRGSGRAAAAVQQAERLCAGRWAVAAVAGTAGSERTGCGTNKHSITSASASAAAMRVRRRSSSARAWSLITQSRGVRLLWALLGVRFGDTYSLASA